MAEVRKQLAVYVAELGSKTPPGVHRLSLRRSCAHGPFSFRMLDRSAKASGRRVEISFSGTTLIVNPSLSRMLDDTQLELHIQGGRWQIRMLTLYSDQQPNVRPIDLWNSKGVLFSDALIQSSD